MNEQRHGRESSTARRESDDRSTGRADDMGVVPARQPDVTPQRTLVPPIAPNNAGAAREPAATIGAGDDVRLAAATASERRHLRAVERPAGEHPRRDPLGTAVETVGAAVGWTAGYVKNRRPEQMRSDAERFVVASPALALVAALGFGYLLGSFMRR